MRIAGRLKKFMKKAKLLGFLVFECKKAKGFYLTSNEDLAKKLGCSKDLVRLNLNNLLSEKMINWTSEPQEFSRHKVKKIWINYDNLKPASLMKKK